MKAPLLKWIIVVLLVVAPSGYISILGYLPAKISFYLCISYYTAFSFYSFVPVLLMKNDLIFLAMIPIKGVFLTLSLATKLGMQ